MTVENSVMALVIAIRSFLEGLNEFDTITGH